MLCFRVGQERHLHRHAYSVVGTERSSLRFHPFALNLGLYRVCIEVEREACHLLTNHVHVALDHGYGLVFISFCRGLTNQYVTRLVLQGLQA